MARQFKVSQQPVPAEHTSINRAIRNEGILFVSMLFVGLVLLPIAVFLTGRAVFGDYGGAGFGDFYGRLFTQLRAGLPVVWFMVLSPYLLWQIARLTIKSYKSIGRQSTA